MNKTYFVLLFVALTFLTGSGIPRPADRESSPLTAEEMRSVRGGADPVEPCYRRDAANCPASYGSDCQDTACAPVYGPGFPPPLIGFVCPQTDWRVQIRSFYYTCHAYRPGEQGDGNDNCTTNPDYVCGFTIRCTTCSPDPARGWWFCDNAEQQTTNREPSAVLSGPACQVRHTE